MNQSTRCLLSTVWLSYQIKVILVWCLLWNNFLGSVTILNYSEIYVKFLCALDKAL